MGKRGPKPANMVDLNFWEFEWYKALHRLRDGTELPRANVAPPKWTIEEAEARLETLRQETPAKIERRIKREWEKRTRPPAKTEQQNLPAMVEVEILNVDSEIGYIEHLIYEKKIKELAKRQKTWAALIRARTIGPLKEVCEQWRRWIFVTHRGPVKRLADGRVQIFYFPAPNYVLAHAKEFFRMKRDARFPKSAFADESRLQFIARGMAGVMIGRSPMTAIERLRNLKHAPDGPLWDEKGKICTCWRCRLKRWSEVGEERKEIGQ